MISTEFCTCHDSIAVVACVKICSYPITRNFVTLQENKYFNQNWWVKNHWYNGSMHAIAEQHQGKPHPAPGLFFIASCCVQTWLFHTGAAGSGSWITHFQTWLLWINSLAPGRYGSNLKLAIFKKLYHGSIDIVSTSYEIALRRMPQDLSGSGLMPSGNKPLPKPTLNQIYVTIERHLATTSLHT